MREIDDAEDAEDERQPGWVQTAAGRTAVPFGIWTRMTHAGAIMLERERFSPRALLWQAVCLDSAELAARRSVRQHFWRRCLMYLFAAAQSAQVEILDRVMRRPELEGVRGL